jgi:hypothetical protein
LFFGEDEGHWEDSGLEVNYVASSSLPSAQLRTGAGTHTPRPPDRVLKVETFFKQQMTGVMGPCVRRDDVEVAG